MSLLSRKRIAAGAVVCALGLVSVDGVHTAFAQEVTFVPRAELTGEWASNRVLTIPAQSSSDVALSGGGDLLRVTPRSDIELRPLLTFQKATVAAVDRLEALVDLASDYRSLKGTYTFNAQYHREDAYNAAYGIAGFNNLNPGVPDTSGTGTVVTGLTKSTYHVEPEFSYKLTQRWSAEGLAYFDAIRYSNDIPQQLVSYNSPYIEANAVYALSQISQIGFGPYYTKFDPIRHDVGAVESNDYGVDGSYRIRSSAVNTSTVTVRVERDRSPSFLPGSLVPNGPDATSTSWGLEWVGVHRFLTSQVRYSIGRFLEPSSFGGRTAQDQVRVQYTRSLTERFSVNGAVRLLVNKNVGTLQDDGSRNRALAVASARYLFTEQLYLAGGYRFAYQHLPSQSHYVDSHGVFITFGYQGREPRRD